MNKFTAVAQAAAPPTALRDGETIEADYIIIGAGAMGLAFADVLLSETDATMAIIDRQDRPGGHWNHAYPFVRLHQPSDFYGVNSRPLGEGRRDAVGRNAGLMELASAPELLGYFETLMRRDLLPSGRVRYCPQCVFEPEGEAGRGRVRSLATGAAARIVPRRRLVDATYMNVRVPATEPPAFAVAPGADVRPPGALGALESPYERICVIGGGKTAMDACLYLLDLGVAPARITWVRPRDSWMIDRGKVQRPGEFMGYFIDQLGPVTQAESVDDLLLRLEETGALMRFDPAVRPTMYRCATISRAELTDLRRIEDVVRLGRVTEVQPGRVTLERGAVETPAETLFVNCTADGLERRPERPVFDGARMTLQAVRPCQQLFSAAFIAHVEASPEGWDEARKNALCAPTPHPDEADAYPDFLKAMLGGLLRWAAEPSLVAWLAAARLDAAVTDETAALLKGAGPTPPDALFAMIDAALARLDALAVSQPFQESAP